MQRCEVVIVGSGFAGSLLARVLAVLGYDVVLLERGTHPRFAIGESTTPLANLSLERLGMRYGLADCYHLATHGRWMRSSARAASRPEARVHLLPPPSRSTVRRPWIEVGAAAGRGEPGRRALGHALDARRRGSSFVRQAVAAGVDYRDRTEVTRAEFAADGARLEGTRDGVPFELHAGFVIDASGPGGFLERQLSIPSGIERTETRAAIVFSHFDGVRLMSDVVPGMPDGPYPDDWAAVHHLIDEGWMYSLRYDDGVTSAGFLLTPRGIASLEGGRLDRCGGALAHAPATLSDDRERVRRCEAAHADRLRPAIQHRLTRATGERWAMLPHAYAFVDPLFSTGIAWGLRAVERLALAFEAAASDRRIPDRDVLARYDAALGAEADQIDLVVAGAYEAMAHFDLFAAQAMLYFAHRVVRRGEPARGARRSGGVEGLSRRRRQRARTTAAREPSAAARDHAR